MKSNTKKVTNKSKAFAVGTHEGQIFASVPYTSEDFKNSLLIVSLLVNASIFILWILTQVHSDYALTVAQAIVQ
ncbi:MAG: hypothetical protein Q7T74_00775 [Candidatus Saccharibacteria bacterium]|nr:hypothetical protein [Candidatus Saccharibacteria bacterium]